MLRPVWVLKIVKAGIDTYNLKLRLAADGSLQQKGVDYDHSWSPTSNAFLFCTTIMWAANQCLTLAVTDVENCFQNTIIENKKRIFMHLPPLYMKWLKHYYPKTEVRRGPSGKLVIEAFKGVQGDRSIGRSWFLLLRRLFRSFKLLPCPQEQALYKCEQDNQALIVNTSTDDFLCAYSNPSICESFKSLLKRYFTITEKTGSTIFYLNIKIIQTSHGISCDQTEHIKEKIVKPRFGETNTFKKTHSPFLVNNQYENQLSEQLPATPTQLKQLEATHGGSFAHKIGAVLFYYVWTRQDLGYACTR